MLKRGSNLRCFCRLLLALGDFGRPMIVTPGTPLERVKILRDALAKTLNDPEVVAEAKKSRMDVDPTTGEELKNLIKNSILHRTFLNG
jgi:tripartite-type tricarboxylate transporter receptor subunit TctC